MITRVLHECSRLWCRYMICRRKLRKLTGEKLIVILTTAVFLLQLLIVVTAVKGQERPSDAQVPAKVQDRITGIVVDENEKILPGASVVIKQTGRQQLTDSNGHFEFRSLPQDAVLVVSFLGYKSVTIVVSENPLPLRIQLEPLAVQMQEVIINTGYQDIPRERATGSFVTVSREQFTRQLATDVIGRLKGVSPSLLFDERSGARKLSLRGRSTIYANDQPLVVVDNFPYDGDINNLDPNDVESVSILRDAAAASVWGARAGNGVIVITTRKGRLNQPLAVELSSSFSVDQLPDLYYQPGISPSDFIDTEIMLFNRGFYNADLANSTSRPPVSPVVDILNRVNNGLLAAGEAESMINGYRNQDLRKDLEKFFYQHGIKQQHGISLRGGGNVSAYYFSANFNDNQNNEVGNNYNRLTLNANQIFRPAKHVELTAGITYAQSSRRINKSLSELFTGGPLGKVMFPYARLVDASGKPQALLKDYNAGFKETAVSLGLLDWSYVPLDELDLADNTARQIDTRITGGIKVQLLPGLNSEFRYQFERQMQDGHDFRRPESYFVRNLVNRYSTVNGLSVARNIPEGGFLNKSSGILNAHNGRMQLNYDQSWNDHRISSLAGVEIREVQSTGSRNRYYGYDPNIGSSVPVNYTAGYSLYPTGFGLIPTEQGISGTLDRYRSYFGTASYSYKDRYTIYGSARIDQSNLFGLNRNQRAVPLWSSGLRWDIAHENFYHIASLPKLALRLSYGFNGNIDKSVTALTTANFSSNIVTGMPSANINNPPNPNLGWEKTGILNIEAEFGFKNDVVTGIISYYRKRGEDLIGNSPLEPTAGLVMYRGNVASMSGQGADILLNSVNVDKKLRWESTVQFSYTTDKVTRYDVAPALSVYMADASLTGSPSSISPTVGKPLFGIYSRRWAGLDPQTGDPRGYVNGSPSTDYSALVSFTGKTVDSLVFNGRALPPVFGAVMNSIGYKRFTASFNIGYRVGHFFKRNSIDYGALFSQWKGHGDFAQRWQKPGDELTTQVPSMPLVVNATRDSFYKDAEVLVEKGDNVRLQDVNLSYHLNRLRQRRLPFQALQVYMNLNNVGLLWTANKSGIDPDFPQMRQPMTISFGLRTIL